MAYWPWPVDVHHRVVDAHERRPPDRLRHERPVPHGIAVELREHGRRGVRVQQDGVVQRRAVYGVDLVDRDGEVGGCPAGGAVVARAGEVGGLAAGDSLDERPQLGRRGAAGADVQPTADLGTFSCGVLVMAC